MGLLKRGAAEKYLGWYFVNYFEPGIKMQNIEYYKTVKT